MRTAYVAMLVIAVLAAGGWFGWQHHQHVHAKQVAAAEAATEALLAHTTTLHAPLAVDPTYTACNGVGDLCITSSASRTTMVAALEQQLGGLGISLGPPVCDGLVAPPGSTNSCQLAGDRDGAKVIVLVGVHNSPYWAQPAWAWVDVPDEGHSRPIESTSSPSPITAARSLVPAGWKLTSCVQPGSTCNRVDVRVTGTVDDATSAFAEQLVRLGYGVGDSTTLCRQTPGQQRTCGFLAARYYFDHGEREASVTFRLYQSRPGVATGWMFLMGSA